MPQLIWPANCNLYIKAFMKTILLVTGSIALLSLMYACENADARYVDLNNGRTVKLVKDSTSGLMVDAETNEPLDIYVDTETRDTIDGRTGAIINGKVRKEDDGRYVYLREEKSPNRTAQVQADNEPTGAYKIKSGDYKKKVEKDGDIKIKDGNVKIKIDGETGERKVKIDD